MFCTCQKPSLSLRASNQLGDENAQRSLAEPLLPSRTKNNFLPLLYSLQNFVYKLWQLPITKKSGWQQSNYWNLDQNKKYFPRKFASLFNSEISLISNFLVCISVKMLKTFWQMIYFAEKCMFSAETNKNCNLQLNFSTFKNMKFNEIRSNMIKSTTVTQTEIIYRHFKTSFAFFKGSKTFFYALSFE